MLKPLKVSQKLNLGYLLTLGITFLGTMTGVSISEYYHHRSLNRIEDSLEEAKLLHRLQISLLKAKDHQQSLAFLISQPEEFTEAFNEWQDYVVAIEQLLQKLESDYFTSKIKESAAEEALVAQLKLDYQNIVQVYLKSTTKLIETIEIEQLTPQQEEAIIVSLTEFNRSSLVYQLHKFIDNLAIAAELINQEVEDANAAFYTANELRLQIMMIATLISLCMASLLAFYFNRIIVAPLHSLNQVTQQVTQESNFTLRATITTEDEIGTLANSINQLIEWMGVHTQEVNLARVTLQQQAQQLSGIIDNLADGLLVTARNGRVIRSNPALLDMFACKNRKSVEGKSTQSVFGIQLAQLVTKNQLQPETIITGEVDLTEGKIGQASVSAILMENTFTKQIECLGSIVLIRDITVEKEIDRMKNDFISTVSHELRTPLTSVLGFAKLIKKKLANVILPQVDLEVSKNQKAANQILNNLNIIVSEGERLTSIINDVLDIAKIESGQIKWEMELISISELINQAIATTSVLFQSKNLELINLAAPELPEIIGDRSRLMQVIINLLANAVKFTQFGSVTCRTQLVDQEILISIIDTGVGVSDQEKKTIFAKFQQAGDTLTEKPKGTGLGLSICKEIVEHHGGHIWVENNASQGSNFSFTLPVQNGV